MNLKKLFLLIFSSFWHLNLLADLYQVQVENTSPHDLVVVLYEPSGSKVSIQSGQSMLIKTGCSYIDVMVQTKLGQGWSSDTCLAKDYINHLFIHYDGSMKINGQLLVGPEEEKLQLSFTEEYSLGETDIVFP